MNEVKIAYLRSIERTTQCELTFRLIISHPRFGLINEEVKSVRQMEDNVASLITHTKNKIAKLFQDKGNHEGVDQLDVDMHASLSRNEQEFSGTMTCTELLQYKHKIKFKIYDTTYRVVVNAPLIFMFTLPNVIYANTCIKPLHLKGIHFHKGLSKYNWSKSKDKVHWTDIFHEINYNTTPEDLNHYLKLACWPCSGDRTPGPKVEVISENVVDEMPGLPASFLLYRKKYIEHKLSGKAIRVVSYNTLAARYSDDNQFEYCDPEYLAIDYRKQLIFEEIKSYNADIICLQEMDLDHYHNYFKVHFKNNNYVPVFYKKGYIIPEGLAFIFDGNRFRKLQCNQIVFSHELKKNPIFKDIWKFIKKRKEVKELFVKQHTSLLVTILKSIETNDVLIIANTHLYYHREAAHIRVLQVAMALKYIKHQYDNIKNTADGKISVIFCGDFNSRPDTAVYQFLSEGNVPPCEELESLGGGTYEIFQHSFDFVSACGTPEFTNYTDDFKGCLDYIFCQKNVKIVQVLPFPPEKDLAVHVALPNQHFPSDHIALVADLML